MNRVYRYGLLEPTLNAGLVYEQMRGAHRYRNQLVEIERARRVALQESNADKDRINTLAADLRRGARALTPVYWGTYLLIESADDQARKSATNPNFVRWDGDGAVAVQIQKGMSPIELKDDRRVQLTSPDKRGHALLRLRVGSDGRDPIWAEWPVILHRPIPPDAIIKGVSVHMRRCGRKSIWSVEFSLVLPQPERTCGIGAVGVDLGWRMIDGDERVGSFASEDGTDVGELRLTAYELGGFDRVESLCSTRAHLRNELQKKLLAYREESSKLFREETKYLHVWRSAGKYFRLAKRIGPNDAPALALLEEWMYRDTHLSDWEVNQRQKCIDSRKAKYSMFAFMLASKYETLVLEKFDLRKFARRPAKEAPRGPHNRQESHQEEKARAQRHEACTSMLRAVLRNAFERKGGRVVEVSAVDTTRICNHCGLVVDLDFAASIDWTCDGCGTKHDQDVNASNNLCARWRAEENAATARNDKSSKIMTKRESKWSRLKREKKEKATSREATDNSAE